LKNKLGIVVYAYNPCYVEGTGRRTKARGWPGQKYETLFDKSIKAKRAEAMDQEQGPEFKL
jgi:hypothetical protein